MSVLRLHLRLLSRRRDGLAIFSFHGLTPRPLEVTDWCYLDIRKFSSLVEFIATHHQVVSLSEALEQLKTGKLKRPTAVLTFDDGFQSVHELAFPLLRSRQLPFAVFPIGPGSVEMPWFCRLHAMISSTPLQQIQWLGQKYALSNPRDKAVSLRKLKKFLKQFPHPQLMAKVDELEDRLKAPPQAASNGIYRLLDERSIRAMNESGFVEFGAHTMSHAILSQLSAEQQRLEIRGSMDAVTELTGKPCHYIAYPNGSARDYNETTLTILRELDVKAGLTTISGVNPPGANLLELRRISVGPSTQLDQLV